MPESILRYRQTALCLALLWLGWAGALHAQILFEEHCYTGGVTVSGAGNSSWGLGRLAAVRWKPGYTYKHIYAVTHRFGRIAPPYHVCKWGGHTLGQLQPGGPRNTPP